MMTVVSESDERSEERRRASVARSSADVESSRISISGRRTSAREIETLPLSCLALTAELATRFLGDYLLGDPYFKTDYPEHNLVRTRCQIALAKDMLRHMEEMRQIVETCAAR